MMTRTRPIIGITMGDPAGIGPEILVSAFQDARVHTCCRPLAIGDAAVIGKAAGLTGADLRLNPVNDLNDGIYAPGALDVLNISSLDPESVAPGLPSARTGQAMIDYITTAVDLAMAGSIAGITTCPITKTAMRLAGSDFHGHTELIAKQCGTTDFAMMMAGERLRVVLVTIHMPLSAVPTALSRSAILKTIFLTEKSLKERFRIPEPRIAVAGLNPHAGEEGMFGSEEETLIRPSVLEACSRGLTVYGPLPPDTLFHHAAGGRYDAVVCMYHDQGLIPFKMMHFSDGVNTTLGLPIIRTSVDHGTAYDIAWKGLADPGSLIAAITMAAFQAGSRPV